ncbi:MAG: transposase, partial [Chloroflexi bacterium]|nr:transposase [Chloroflexota bacterium]
MPNDYNTLLALFAVHFDARVWKHAQVLLTGTILARGQRTVCAALRIMGRSDEQHFQNYHRVLSRAVWSCHALAQTLLQLLVRVFVPDGPIIMGGDETIERRRGAQINVKGIYRDPVRSSRSHFVKTSGLRWITVMLLSPIPFAQRIWALPFLTMLAPSERFYADKARAYKTMLDWMRRALLQVRRWLPARARVFVGDNSYASIAFLWRLTQLANPIKMVVRFRM